MKPKILIATNDGRVTYIASTIDIDIYLVEWDQQHENPDPEVLKEPYTYDALLTPKQFQEVLDVNIRDIEQIKQILQNPERM